MSLSQKHCVPCEGGVDPLAGAKLETYLQVVANWQAVENQKKIQREFTFTNFKDALNFVNKVGAIAEAEQHHPDIFLHDYKIVTISLWTHAIGGLSENDFILAVKIDGLV